ncbi:MAG: putative oxysterol binding family protein [Streblomastix strix]|uniref:Putative oxysterol binding family protein n=1 Tax=Streblomastix strix TaxID=222440 RepID=A0A5J4WPE6_9EUKA|nr:MAG: putative oxysterol binding family protein [Streblomastix strix]
MSNQQEEEDEEVRMATALAEGISEETKLDDSMRVELNSLITEKVVDDFSDLKRPSGHRTNNPILIRYQKAVVFSLVADAGKSLMKGRSLLNISLPDAWANIAELLRAADTTDPVERLKHVAVFTISGLRYTVLQAKPFNPILGETFQATYPGNIKLYMEQVTHHPPASCWMLTDDETKKRFVFTGTAEYNASFRGNTIHARQFGPQQISFADGTHIEWSWPTLTMVGYIYGGRFSNYKGTIIFRYPEHNLQCSITFGFGKNGGFFKSMGKFFGFGKKDKGKERPGDYFTGEIARYSLLPEDPLFPIPASTPSQHSSSPSSSEADYVYPDEIDDEDDDEEDEDKKKHSSKKKGDEQKQKGVKEKVISVVDGTWLGYMDFDGKRYWDVRDVNPVQPTIINLDNKSHSANSYQPQQKTRLAQMADKQKEEEEEEKQKEDQKEDQKEEEKREETKQPEVNDTTNLIHDPSSSIYSDETTTFLLPSDARYRRDRQYLERKMLNQAQKAKEEMEDLQRKQAALREKGKKERVFYSHTGKK